MRILDLLHDGARPGARLEVWPDNGTSTALEDLWRRSERASRWIAGRTEIGEPVGFLLENTTACLTGVLGAWRAGATVVSLPLRAAGVTAAGYGASLRSLLEQVGARVVLSGAPTAERLAAWNEVDAPPVSSHAFEEVVEGNGPAREQHGEFVQFSSGTTGSPKGILLRPEALAANAVAIVTRYDDGVPMVSASWLPMSHDMGLVGLCLAPWAYCGLGGGRDGRIVLARPETFLRSPSSWMRLCSEKRATVTGGPTFALDAAVAAHRATSLDLSSLRVICVGGEPVWPDSLRRFAETLAPAGLREFVLSPAYGLAEATLGVTAVGPDEPWISQSIRGVAGLEAETVSAGRPLDGVEVRTADDGEIQVRSPSLLTRYVVGPPSPMSGDGWYRTGDFGRVVDGHLYVLGRRDDLMTVAGRNIRATEVEQRLEAGPDLDLSACALLPDGSRCVVVCARKVPSSGESAEEIARRVRAAATVALGTAPPRVLFVSRRAIRRTGTGKLQRRALLRAYASGELRVVFELPIHPLRQRGRMTDGPKRGDDE